MSTATHTAIIKDGISACTCRLWNGPRRHDDETYGEYTTRAYNAHLQHKERVTNQPEQAPSMFAQQQELFQ